MIALALAVRAYVAWQSAVINSDGVLYLHQAKNLFLHHWDQVTACGLPYLSNYTILIALVYPLVGDWTQSGMLISIAAGTLTLIPVYHLFGLYFNATVRVIGTTLFALIPVMVHRSADIMRDPLSWLFLATGLLLVLQALRRNTLWRYPVGCLCLLMAAWARIECILYIAVTAGWMAVAPGRHRLRRLSLFLLPLVFAMIPFLLNASYGGESIQIVNRTPEIVTKTAQPLNGYHALRNTLKHGEVHVQPPNPLVDRFLSRARSHVWVIGLATLLNAFLEGFSYPFAALILIGMVKMRAIETKDPERLFLSLLIVAGLLLLYLHLLETWLMEYRFFAIVLFPCFYPAAVGIQWLLDLVQKRLNCRKQVAAALILLALLTSGLARALPPMDADKRIYREIGQTIARHNGPGAVATVLATVDIQRWVIFYANEQADETVCPIPFSPEAFRDIIGTDCTGLGQRLTKQGIRYLLYEDLNWPKGGCRLPDNPLPDHFTLLGGWHHPDTGRMALYAVKE